MTSLIQLITVLGLMGMLIEASQLPASNPAPRFEAASIKAHQEEIGPVISVHGCAGVDQLGATPRSSIPIGRCRLSNANLREIIGFAFREIVGGNQLNQRILNTPSWYDTDRFDVEGKAEGAVTTAELVLMLQNLLAERFNFRFHRESRTVSGLALIVGRNGVKLKEAASDMKGGIRQELVRGELHTVFQRQPIESLVNHLARRLEVPVADRTGLTGAYDFALVARDTPLASIQELGLRLEKGQISIDVLVIDHVERPTLN